MKRLFVTLLTLIVSFGAFAQIQWVERDYDRGHGRTRDPRYSYREVFLGNVRVHQVARPVFEDIDSCRRYNGLRVSALQLTALRDDVVIHSLRVRYGNGDVDVIPAARGHLYSRESTRWLDLEGRGRCIESVSIVAEETDTPWDRYSPNAIVQITGLMF